MATTCVPVLLVALFQFRLSLSRGEADGIGVKFLYVWKSFTENWGLSLAVSVAFPALTCLYLAGKKKWNAELTLGVLVFASAMIQYMLFYMKVAPFSGDFSWGFQLSIFLLFAISTEELLNFSTEANELRIDFLCKCLLWIVFFLHFYYGVRYCVSYCLPWIS